MGAPYTIQIALVPPRMAVRRQIPHPALTGPYDFIMISLQYQARSRTCPVKRAQTAATEVVVNAANGWLMLLLNFALGRHRRLFVASPGQTPRCRCGQSSPAACLRVATFLMLLGYFTLQPNQARVLMLFGAYKGTVRESGFHWANPLYSRYRGNATRMIPASAESPRKGKRPFQAPGMAQLADQQDLAARSQFQQRHPQSQ